MEIVPYVPIASTLRFGVAIFSYCGQVTVGITGDYDGAADVWTLAEGMEHGMAELVATGEARVHTTPLSAPASPPMMFVVTGAGRRP